MTRTALTFKKPYRTERNDWRIYRNSAYVGGLSRSKNEEGVWVWFAWIDSEAGQSRIAIPDNSSAATAKRIVRAAWN